MGVLEYVAYVILGLMLILAIGVFLYGRVLDKTKLDKDKAIAKATAGLDAATVSQYVKLHDRLVTGQTLLSNHVAFSAVLPVLETTIPRMIRFTVIHLGYDEKGAPKLEAQGTSNNYNVLAAASESFAAEAKIKGAIFSSIAPQKNGTVSFSLSAKIDPAVISFTP